MTSIEVRVATRADVEGLNAIYNEYIVDSHVSFDTEIWSARKRAAWLDDRAASGYPVMVAERDGNVIGCAWSGPWRDKDAYRMTVETTVVLASGEFGHGAGTVLYQALLGELAERGFHTAIGVVALPNDASIALHEKLGYRVVGTLEDVGFKLGVHHGTMILQKLLAEG